ncbi:hypothetical protein P8452_38222 [Trifolium repens]|nr:hypothetical protein P8452_38222 [Trifolium repens]
MAIETLDDSQPSVPQKLDDHSDQTKPKEVKVVVEQDVSVEVDKSREEKKEIDEQDDSEKDDANEGGDEDDEEIFVSLNQLLSNSVVTEGREKSSKRRLLSPLTNIGCFTETQYSNIATYILQQPTLQLFDQKPKDEALYQDKNSGSSSLEVEETDVGGLLVLVEKVAHRQKKMSLNPN